ncbi:MAG TPA: hypothetical protein PKM43_18740 [Verrucomicrobiota bacterium]|nr:hypothetical protein [Verrucomicrobiota bacterium]
MIVRAILAVSLVAALALESAANRDPVVSLQGPLVSRALPDTVCGTLLWNADQSFETAYGWQYEGVVPPYYGAFAESYHGEWEVCAAVFGFTTTYDPTGKVMDVYVWGDASGVPGNVLCAVPGVDPGPVAQWPFVSFHEVRLSGCCTGTDWWVGYWGAWPGEVAWWFTAADEDGPGGDPKTNIAPGLGYPTGWQDVMIPFGPTQALAIGAEVIPCTAIPVQESSWGRIKSIYQSP